MSNTELVQSYRQQINNNINHFNLQLFWNMYNRWKLKLSVFLSNINICNMNNKRNNKHKHAAFFFLNSSILSYPFQSEGLGDEPQWDSA